MGDTTLPPESQRLGAPELRQLGVESFQEGDFSAAHGHFLRAVDLCQQDFSSLCDDGAKDAVNLARRAEVMKLLFSCVLNVASCAVKIGEYTEAVSMATHALEIDNESSKALYRRGQAHRALRNYAAAKRDFAAARVLQPDTVEFQQEHDGVDADRRAALGNLEPGVADAYMASVDGSATGSGAEAKAVRAAALQRALEQEEGIRASLGDDA